MADLGFLNFGVGVNGEDLLAKALEKDKQEALEVQKILASLTIPGIQFKVPDDAISKSQQAADKAALSAVKLGEAREKAAASSLLGEQKLQTEIEKTAAIQGKSAAEIASIEKAAADKAALAQKKIATETERTAAVRAAASRKEMSDDEKIVALLKKREAEQRLLKQKLLTEIERTNAANMRGMRISHDGQVSFNNAAGLTNKTLFSQKNLLNQISNAAGIYFSIYEVGAFVKNLALVSGEFEMQRISLENILQDVDAANKLFGQIKTLSVVSPFEFKDLVGYAKQLSAFSIPVNELYDTTKRLADVSAGLGVDMGRIILAYGQVRSASVLRGQELRQFTEAGIPLVDELAKKFGELEGRVVSAGEVFDKISNRLVPFAMVKDVFNDLTSEGGKFFEMQERQAESLKGKIANLKDAYDIMLYSIGTANDGILKGGVEGVTSLMKNWEAFANSLMTVVAAYGVYRTAVILNTVITKGFTEAIRLSTIAMKIHDAALKSTPWGLALAAITALISGIVFYTSSIRKSNEELMEAIGAINKQSDSCNELIDKLKLLTTATDGEKKAASERAEIITKLNNLEPELAKNIKDHATNLDELTKIQEKYNALMDARKFGMYAISDSGGGLFEEGIITDLKDLTEAENKNDMAAVRLDLTYTKLKETLLDINKNGGVDTNIGIQPLSNTEAKKIEEAMKSSLSNAEKVSEIYKLLSKKESIAGTNLFNDVFNGKDRANANAYITSMIDLKKATEEADEEIRVLEIQLRANFKNKGISVFDPKMKEEMRGYINNLEGLSKYAKEKISIKWGIKLEGSESADNTLDGWRKEIKDIVGNSILIQTDSNIDDTIKDIQEKISDNKKKIENLKPTLIKYGFDFEKMEFPDVKVLKPEIQDTLLVMATGYKAVNTEQKNLLTAQELIGFHQKKEKGDNKDPRAEKLKKEVDLIKDAYKEYKNLSKMMSKPLALKEIKKQDQYKNVDIPIDSDSMTLELKKFYEKAKQLNSKDGAKLADEINKELSTESLEQYTKGYTKMISKIEDEIDKFKGSYDFYEKLLGAGEDKQNAIKIAFGVEFEGQSIDPMKYFSDKIKEAAKAAKFNLDFDINKGSIKDQIGDAYNSLTPELKKQIDSIDKYRQDSFENSYLKYLGFINKETPMGSGITFDFSKVLAKMQDGINDANKTFDDLKDDDTGKIDKEKLTTQRDLEIKYRNEIALNETKNIGAEFIERSLKNSQYWNEYKNLSNASYGDTKKILEELSKIQEEALSKGGLSKIFSTNQMTGEKQTEEDKAAFNPILGELGNAENIAKLNEQVDLYLQNITAHKEYGIELDEKMQGLNSSQLTKLQLILTFIKSISKGIEEAEGKTRKIQLNDQIKAFKSLSNAAANVIDNVEGLADAFGAEFDDITKGSLDVVKTIASTSMDVADTLTSFVDTNGKAMSLSAMLAGDAIQKVEAASVILMIISAALQIAMKIASIFTGNKTKKTDDAIKEQQEQLDDLQRSYDQTEKSAEKFYTLEADSTSISKWLSSEKAAINARYGFLKRFGKMGEEALNSMYKNAEKEAKSMEDMSYLQVQQKNMEQQKRALKEQIKAAEGDNKKGKRNDEIDGYKNQLKDLDVKLAETRDKWYETLRGFSMQDVANDFAEAWVEAFEKGEDSIDALDKKFNELIKNMIIKQAAMRVVSKIMQPMLDMIDTAIGEDGVLTENEIGGIMGALPDTLKKINDGMNGIIKPLLDKMGITFGSASEAGEGLSKGIAGVTEDTANLLASYLNAMRADLANQKIYFQKIIDAIIPMSNNFALQVAELKKIEANTYRTANNTEENVKILNRIEGVLNSITRQGSGKKINI